MTLVIHGKPAPQPRVRAYRLGNRAGVYDPRLGNGVVVASHNPKYKIVAYNLEKISTSENVKLFSALFTAMRRLPESYDEGCTIAKQCMYYKKNK